MDFWKTLGTLLDTHTHRDTTVPLFLPHFQEEKHNVFLFFSGRGSWFLNFRELQPLVSCDLKHGKWLGPWVDKLTFRMSPHLFALQVPHDTQPNGTGCFAWCYSIQKDALSSTWFDAFYCNVGEIDHFFRAAIILERPFWGTSIFGARHSATAKMNLQRTGLSSQRGAEDARRRLSWQGLFLNMTRSVVIHWGLMGYLKTFTWWAQRWALIFSMQGSCRVWLGNSTDNRHNYGHLRDKTWYSYSWCNCYKQ